MGIDDPQIRPRVIEAGWRVIARYRSGTLDADPAKQAGLLCDALLAVMPIAELADASLSFGDDVTAAIYAIAAVASISHDRHMAPYANETSDGPGRY